MESKVWWKSTTMIGILALGVSFLCKILDVEVMDAEVQSMAEDLMGAIGFAVAIIGRKKAKGPITLTSAK